MNNTFLSALAGRVLVCDGAMGTMLQAAGMPVGHCSEEWNISHPKVIQSIHQAYIDAGADIVETNSFGGTRFRLEAHGHGDSVSEFNQKAAQIAKSVCPEGKWVGGSVGPTGEFMQPLGTRSYDEIKDVFKEQIGFLISGGADIIIVETMSDLQEGKAAIEAARSLDSEIPVIGTMTFENKPTGFRTMMGVQPGQMIDCYGEAGANVIGANCGSGMEEMIQILNLLRPETPLPILTQANAGLPETESGKIIYKETAEDRYHSVIEILKNGANIVGGCCGTNPEHIKATARAVQEFNKQNLK